MNPVSHRRLGGRNRPDAGLPRLDVDFGSDVPVAADHRVAVVGGQLGHLPSAAMKRSFLHLPLGACLAGAMDAAHDDTGLAGPSDVHPDVPAVVGEFGCGQTDPDIRESGAAQHRDPAPALWCSGTPRPDASRRPKRAPGLRPAARRRRGSPAGIPRRPRFATASAADPDSPAERSRTAARMPLTLMVLTITAGNLPCGTGGIAFTVEL